MTSSAATVAIASLFAPRAQPIPRRPMPRPRRPKVPIPQGVVLGGNRLPVSARKEAAALYTLLCRGQSTLESLRRLISVPEHEKDTLFGFAEHFPEELPYVVEAMELRRLVLEEFDGLVAEGTAALAKTSTAADLSLGAVQVGDAGLEFSDLGEQSLQLASVR